MPRGLAEVQLPSEKRLSGSSAQEPGIKECMYCVNSPAGAVVWLHNSALSGGIRIEGGRYAMYQTTVQSCKLGPIIFLAYYALA